MRETFMPLDPEMAVINADEDGEGRYERLSGNGVGVRRGGGTRAMEGVLGNGEDHGFRQPIAAACGGTGQPAGHEGGIL